MNFVEQLNKIHSRLIEEERRQAAIDSFKKEQSDRVRRGREELLEKVLCGSPEQIRMMTIHNCKNGVCDQLYALAKESDETTKEMVEEATNILWQDEVDYIFSDLDESDLGMTL